MYSRYYPVKFRSRRIREFKMLGLDLFSRIRQIVGMVGNSFNFTYRLQDP